MFGREPVDDAIGQVRDVLAGWGYSAREPDLTAMICHMLLLNRSPLLEDLSSDGCCGCAPIPRWERIGRPSRRPPGRGRARARRPAAATEHGRAGGDHGTAHAWADWVERWHAHSTLTPKVRGIYRSVLAKTGRWLAAEHPDITEPGQWTRQTCAAWVAAVDRMSVGDYVQWIDGMRGRAGEPLCAQTKSGYLRMTRTFFRDLQEWEWIPRRFDPATALGTPRSVNALLGPEPRVIADDIWAKLLWAGLNLKPTTRAHAERPLPPA